MFSKEDYIKYFLQIRKVEADMRDKFLKYSGTVDDPELKKFFFRLHREENAHNNVVNGMLESFGYRDKEGGPDAKKSGTGRDTKKGRQ